MSKINKLVMRFAGMDHFGDGRYGPPEAKPLRYITHRDKLTVVGPEEKEYQLFSSNNDGFELWMGWSRSWNHHLRQEEVWALFKWIAIEWYLKARWLGLRRPLYYWALKRHVKSYR